MIARYTRPEIGAVWTDEARFGAMRDVEVAAAEALDGPTPEELDAIRAATFTVDAIDEREKILDHDTAAFVDVLAASAGPAGRWIHYGLTSSDVVDTGLALQLKRAGALLVPAARTLAWELAEKAREHADTLCVGRTHGVHAEPTSLRPQARRLRDGDAPQRGAPGARLRADHGRDLRRRRHLRHARAGLRGARRCERSGLTPEAVSTQVVPRDRHAELLSRDRARPAPAWSASRPRSATCSAPRCARSRSRSARARRARARCRTSATRSSASASAGSRASCAATPRSALENVALWHERDITHSSAERIVLPDSTILLDQVLALTLRVVRGMTVHADRMRANLEITSGALFSQRVLLALVATGMQRDDAYRIVQRLGQQAWDTQTPLRTLLEHENVEIDLDEVFDYGYYVRHVPTVLARLEVIPSPS